MLVIESLLHISGLKSIQENGQKLVMMDGTIRIVHPDDIKKAAFWMPPCGIQIDITGVNLEYEHEIINTDEGSLSRLIKDAETAAGLVSTKMFVVCAWFMRIASLCASTYVSLGCEISISIFSNTRSNPCDNNFCILLCMCF